MDVFQVAVHECPHAGSKPCHSRQEWRTHHQDVWEAWHQAYPYLHQICQLTGWWFPLLDLWHTSYRKTGILLLNMWWKMMILELESFKKRYVQLNFLKLWEDYFWNLSFQKILVLESSSFTEEDSWILLLKELKM